MHRQIEPPAIGVIADALRHLHRKIHLRIDGEFAGQEIRAGLFGLRDGLDQRQHPLAEMSEQLIQPGLRRARLDRGPHHAGPLKAAHNHLTLRRNTS